MKRDLRKFISAIMFLGPALPGLLMAQYEIPTAVIGGGGGTSSSTSYQLSGTAGMPAGGIGASSTNYTLDEGFWPTVQALTVGLAGTYVIDPDGGGEFVSFSEAVDALNAGGVTDSVTFLVRSGVAGYTYNEQVTINVISGVSAVNKVVFKPHPENVDDVNWEYDPAAETDNWVVKLDGAQYVTFEGMVFQMWLDGQYSRVFHLVGDADHITINDNEFYANETTSIADIRKAFIFSDVTFAPVPDSVFILDNYFEGNCFGVYLQAASGAPSTFTEISGNDILYQNDHGIYLRYQDAPEIYGNTMEARIGATSYEGITLYNCYNDMEIVGNRIDAGGGDKGININSSDGTSLAHGLVVNNVITVGGASWAQGIVLDGASDWWDIYHNTIDVVGTSVSSGMSIFFKGCSQIDVRNNILANTGGGYAYRTNDVNVPENSMNNVIYTINTTPINVSGATDYTLAAWQTDTGLENNSTDEDPQFYDAANGMYQLLGSSPAIGAGDPTLVLDPPLDEDADWNQRPFPLGSVADIGAYEHVLANQDQAAPATPVNLTASAGYGQVSLGWSANTEGDLGYYTLYRGTSPIIKDWLAEIQAPATTYLDEDVLGNTTYYYWISASDTLHNESAQSSPPASDYVPVPPFSLVYELDGFGESDAAWGDWDGDGDLDVLVSGGSPILGDYTLIYMNELEVDQFTPNATLGLSPMKRGVAVAWGDYNGDDVLDLVLSGLKPDGASEVVFSEIYKGETDQTYTPLNSGLIDFGQGDVAWGDYDNDGDLDLAITGGSATGFVAGMYRNDGGVFTVDPNATWMASYDGSLDLGDYDNDGDLDVLSTGIDNNGALRTAVYNNSGGQFSEYITSMPNVAQGNAVWGDYDCDGDLDILLCGSDGTSNLTKVFSNSGVPDFTFTEIAAGLPGIEDGMAAWGNYDNDGDLDVLLTGLNDVNTGANVTQVFQNDGGTFVDVDIIPDALTKGAAAWGDYDKDGDLDILITGNDEGGTATTKIYRNNSSVTNQPPNTPDPQLLSAEPTGQSVTLSWGGVSDDHTPDAGLTYNLRVGTAPGSQDVMPAHAQPDTGLLRIPIMGNAYHNTSWTLSGLPEDTYYWSVQAIDQAFSGSQFAGEQTFTIRIPPAAPTGFTASAGDGQVELSWAQNQETDLAAYRLYRNEVRDSVNNVVVVYTGGTTELSYTDMDLTNGITYWYWLVAVDDAGNASDYSAAVSARPVGPPQVTVIAPNGGENWNEDTRHFLRWTATDEDEITRVQLLYSLDGGQNYTEIADSVVNDGIRTWIMPRTPTQAALFKVIATDIDDNIREDISDGAFTIQDVDTYLHATGDLDHTVRNDGLTGGFAGLQGATDPSMEFPPGSDNNHLYIGGILLTGINSAGDTVATFDPEMNAYMGDLYRPLEPITDKNPGGRISTQSRFEDKWGLGLQVGQKTIAEDGQSAVIHAYIIKNVGTESYTNLHVGFFGDFDISNYSRNAFGYDLDSRIVYMWNVDRTWDSYAGIRLLDQNPNGIRAWGQMGQPDPTTGKELYERLAQPGPEDTTGAATGDWRIAESAGPYSLAPGDSIRVAYVLAAGADLNDLLATSQQAQDLWTSITTFPPIISGASVIDVSSTSATLTADVNPNGLATNVTFYWGETGGSKTPIVAAQDLTGTAGIDVRADLASLGPDKEYEFYVEAVNSDGAPTSDPVTFRTPVRDDFLKVTDKPPVTEGGAGRGASWVDFNNDGNLDLFVTNTGPTDQAGGSNALYENEGPTTWNLNNVTGGENLTDTYHSNMGVWGDYNNDGNLDLFVTNSLGEANILYRNDGPGNGFTLIPSPFDADGGQSVGAAWADYDNDGNLDLFVANTNGEANFLYHNTGSSNSYALQKVEGATNPIISDGGSSVSGIWADIDGNGFPDLYVTNAPSEPDFLYLNQNGVDFNRVVDAAYPMTQDSTSSAGAAWGDYDNDGDLDLYLALYEYNANVLYQKSDDGSFKTIQADIGPIVTDGDWSRSVTWGDYDNDGDLDLYVTNSGNNALYINDATYIAEGGSDHTFHRMATGLPVTDGLSDYGAAWGDYDNDGDLDLFTASIAGSNTLYANQGSSNRYIKIKLVGTASNRSAVGAKVRVKANISATTSVWQMREVTTATGLLSQNSPEVEFGVGVAVAVDSIVIDWPSGIKQVVLDEPTNSFITVVEQAVYAPAARALPPTALTNTSATLNGEVVPNGGSTEVWFKWGETIQTLTTVQVSDVQGGTEEQPVSLPLTGLTADKTYYYRVRAENSAGFNESSVMEFTTPADENTNVDIQIVVDGPVVFPNTNVTLGITFTSSTGEDTITVAQVQGTPSGSLPVDMNLLTQQLWDISWLGTGTINEVEFTLDVSPATISAEDQADPSNIKLLRRADATVANWEIIAQGVSATQTVVTFSPISGFSQFTIGTELRGVAPTVTTVTADGITTTAAVLHATVNPGGLTTDVEFEWGETTAYGTITDANPSQIPPGTEPVNVSLTLTGLAMNQTHHYRVRATNSESPTPVVGTDLSFTTLFLDEEDPAIVSTAVSTAPPVDVGTAITVTAEITDNVGVDQVTLHHAPGGGQSYNQVAMSPTGTADEYSGVIPQGAVTLRGVVCYVRAADAAGNDSLSAPIFIEVRFGQGGLTTANVSNSAFASGFPRDQWRLISVPADLANSSVNVNIGDELGAQTDTSWRLFEYTGNPTDQWVESNEFDGGEGFWLYQRMISNVELIPGSGQNNDLQQFDIELDPGWNLIGTPYCFRTPILLNDAEFWGPLAYNGSGWSGVVSHMDPWGGYAVHNSTSSTQILTLTAEPDGGIGKEMLAKAAAAEPPSGWILDLQAEGRTYNDLVNSIGRLDGAEEGLDRYDHPEPPYVDGYVSLAMVRPDWNPSFTYYSSDVRSLQEQDGVWDLDLRFKGEQGPVNLSYSLNGDFPADHKIILLDVMTREIYDLSAGENPASITQYREDFPYHLKVVAGSVNYVDNTTEEILAALPDAFALSQNYPNPFNPVTNIRYSLYNPAKVTLKIFNLLGQEVTTLVDDWHDLGHYTVTWNGRDRFGNQLASGIYIAAYLAEGKIYSRKMVMMK